MKLIKNNQKYTIIISSLLESKIRELCIDIKDIEWSGVLFYIIEGDFQHNNLVIKALDLLLMDIGSSTYTEFSLSSDVANYSVENNLFDCYTGLIHSHHSMGTFFSGTDDNTLLSEGSSMPHFVSLIINNAREYSAAITRKNNLVRTYKNRYSWFSSIIEDTREETIEAIEAFPLEVKFESDLKDYFKDRIKAIKDAKAPKVNTESKSFTYPYYYDKVIPSYERGYTLKDFPVKDEPNLFSISKESSLTLESPEIKKITKLLYNALLTSSYNPTDIDSTKILDEKEAIKELQLVYGDDDLGLEAYREDVENVVMLVESDFYETYGYEGDCEAIFDEILKNVRNKLQKLPSNKFIDCCINSLVIKENYGK